ncbi:heme biosynthesis protein HemY [Thiomonas intermedia]|uniref:heme biosynthesis protein HemY n=1 Tax=Thiomonas intermedia TaxID=926 RepID=UPI0009A4B091|nr:heme biosynthesis HemY N-terminal domain-containing protein [Thiomonas intermedia]
MRWLFWVLILAAAAVLVALGTTLNTGNIAVLLPPWRLDISLNFAVVLVLLGFVVFHLMLRGLALLFGMPRAAAEFRARRRLRLAAQALHNGMYDYFGGRFRRAERAAQRAAEFEDFAAAALMTAAQSAQQLQAYDRRDAYLAQLPPQAQDAAALLQAQWQLDAKQPREALAQLRALPAGVQRRTHALRIELQAARKLSDHKAVLRLARTLLKHGALHSAAAQAMLHTAATGLLRQAGDDPQILRGTWSQLTAQERGDPALVVAAARGFAAAQALDEARALLIAALNRAQAEPGLFMPSLRGMLSGIDAGFVAQTEQWLGRWPQEAQAHFLAGAACAELQLWGKAQQHLQKAIQACSDDEGRLRGQIHAALAHLLEGIEREDQAQRHWRAAALDLSALDMPGRGAGQG